MSSRRHRLNNSHDLNIPEKANRILNIILIVFILIIIRVWYLAVVQYEAKEAEFRKPQRKTVIEPARRATIRDRFNIPLAINKVQYKATILYSQFRQIQQFVWTKDSDGKKIKQYKRREYINSLAKLLGKTLNLDPERLKDLIYSKAAFYYNIPFVIKEDITEQEYYRLKMLEKDWVGLLVQRLPKRTYPQGKVAADIIGYLGAINKQEYEAIIHEMNALQEYVTAIEGGEEPELPVGLNSSSEVRQRLKELQEHAYTVNDYVGKVGIEGQFEEMLRGFHGKKSYYSDARGNFLRELPGSREPTPGTRLLLTISSELQEYAERLLIQNEGVRETSPSHPNPFNPYEQKQPWIKGGAIIAIDPNTGELWAMATHPRFDPNDFIPSGKSEEQVKKNSNINRWFETERYIGQVWDMKRPLERERYDVKQKVFKEEAVDMSWDRYLDFILPEDHPVVRSLASIGTIKNAITLQRSAETLLRISGQSSIYALLQALYPNEEHQSYGKRISNIVKHEIDVALKNNPQTKLLRTQLDKYLHSLKQNYDKALLIDLCRLVVDESRFSESLMNLAGSQSLSQYRDATASIAILEPILKKVACTIYHENQFVPWRQEHEKAFLKEKREQEKIALVRYPKPYIDYIDEQERAMFGQFWHEHRWGIVEALLLENSEVDINIISYVELLKDKQQELETGTLTLYEEKAYITARKILKQLPKQAVRSFLDSLRSFHELNRTLLGKYPHLRKQKGVQLEKHLAAAFYPTYGFGYARSYAFRQAASQGSLFKLVTAYTALSQKYQELEERGSRITKEKLNPLEIIDSIEHRGADLYLGSFLDGTPIPQHYKGGRLVRSQKHSIGKIDIIKAIEESSNPYFSLIAGEYLNDPDSLAKASKKFSYGSRTGVDLPLELHGSIPSDLKENRTGVYSMAIGQHTLVVSPLQASVMVSAFANGGKVLKPKIVYTTVGSEKRLPEYSIETPLKFPYQESLSLVAVDFPLFTVTLRTGQQSLVKTVPTYIKRQIWMPQIIRQMILEGMERITARLFHGGLSSLSSLYRNHPEAIQDCIAVRNCLVGKTSTAEAVETIDMDLSTGKNTFTHVWFGGISFGSEEGDHKTYVFEDERGAPELVVIVYLKFGKFGREAAPVAAQIIQKWREIKKKHKAIQTT